MTKLTAKYDAIFKAIMQENKEILVKILEIILEKEIAKQMLNDNVDIELISKYTCLKVKKIKQL